MGRSNFNDLTKTYGKTTFLDEIFCENCKTPVSKNDEACGKCEHEFSFMDKIKAMATQTQLRYENKKNRKYKPPKAFI